LKKRHAGALSENIVFTV